MFATECCWNLNFKNTKKLNTDANFYSCKKNKHLCALESYV